MKTTLSFGAALAGFCVLASAATMAPAGGDPSPPMAVGLMQLREDFHLANTLGDYDLMLSLWTDDAVFNGGGNHVTGAENIADFFASNPLWGTSVSLTSESKACFDVMGNTAQYAFECIIVRVDGGAPLETSLSSLPPGMQNPDVEIVQHSNSMGTAVREDGRWKFLEFNGSGGPL